MQNTGVSFAMFYFQFSRTIHESMSNFHHLYFLLIIIFLFFLVHVNALKINLSNPYGENKKLHKTIQTPFFILIIVLVNLKVLLMFRIFVAQVLFINRLILNSMFILRKRRNFKCMKCFNSKIGGISDSWGIKEWEVSVSIKYNK